MPGYYYQCSQRVAVLQPGVAGPSKKKKKTEMEPKNEAGVQLPEGILIDGGNVTLHCFVFVVLYFFLSCIKFMLGDFCVPQLKEDRTESTSVTGGVFGL